MKRQELAILLIDDHPMMRHGVSHVINKENDMRVCGEVTEPTDALRILADEEPDLVILDMQLRGSAGGMDLLKSIHAQYPLVPVLALAVHDDAFHAERALKAGARGYVIKSATGKELLCAIREVIGGEIHMSIALLKGLVSRFRRDENGITIDIHKLTDRELEVFLMIGEGLVTRDIAERIGVGISTVDTYKARLKEKLFLANSTLLTKTAVEWYLRCRQ